MAERVEGRQEYRVLLRENVGGAPDTEFLAWTEDEARARADDCRSHYRTVRIQGRILTPSPWVDLPHPASVPPGSKGEPK